MQHMLFLYLIATFCPHLLVYTDGQALNWKILMRSDDSQKPVGQDVHYAQLQCGEMQRHATCNKDDKTPKAAQDKLLRQHTKSECWLLKSVC